ncbi:MAG: DNA helicase UvrD [Candidatus Spechtbacteria bacterium RIFCSPHIGHO2_02_FULL_43_15b]|nr:MAG: DNA helicase UvrD [Candidatus Spechtbacteria bacterium RIFCSPHIGHO2_02_FULL_43_15b]
MKYIGDFHIHSHFSRATSRDMNIEELDKWARIKGVNILGTGDFTHPRWLRELRDKLTPAEEGLYKFKNGKSPIRFILTVEVSSIYSEGGRVRRIHNIIFAPSFDAVAKINKRLSEVGNLRADGRPILGLPARELIKIALDASEQCLLVPAHAWTPWFSVFGSKSGYDSIEECFGEMSKYIYAIETGLSSDPSMNWRLSKLDGVTLISNSDCHSASRIGREANVFEGEDFGNGKSEPNYEDIINAIKYSRVSKGKNLRFKLSETIEFFPEEGKYHYDGHRLCRVSLKPEDSRKIKQICPKCGKPFTVGVLSRVEELADRPKGARPKNAIPFKNLVPLAEIIGGALGIGPKTKGVAKEYNKLVEYFGNEFSVLLDADLKDAALVSLPEISEGLRRVRKGELDIEPGYDGEYGKVGIFKDAEKRRKTSQAKLF